MRQDLAVLDSGCIGQLQVCMSRGAKVNDVYVGSEKRRCSVLALFWGGGGRVSLYNSTDCPGTHFVEQSGLVLTEICLSLPSKCWD